MKSSSLKENKILALLMFSVSLLLFTAFIIAFQNKEHFISGALIGFSYLLVLVGRQRVLRWQLNTDKFHQQLMITSLFIVAFGSLGASIS